MCALPDTRAHSVDAAASNIPMGSEATCMAKLPLLTHTESSLGRAAHGVPSSPTSTFAEGFCNAFGKRRLPESAADGTSPNKHGRTNAHHVQNRSLSLSKAPMMLDGVDDVDDTLASNYGSTTTEIRRGLHEALSHSREPILYQDRDHQ